MSPILSLFMVGCNLDEAAETATYFTFLEDYSAIANSLTVVSVHRREVLAHLHEVGAYV